MVLLTSVLRTYYHAGILLQLVSFSPTTVLELYFLAGISQQLVSSVLGQLYSNPYPLLSLDVMVLHLVTSAVFSALYPCWSVDVLMSAVCCFSVSSCWYINLLVCLPHTILLHLFTCTACTFPCSVASCSCYLLPYWQLVLFTSAVCFAQLQKQLCSDVSLKLTLHHTHCSGHASHSL